MGMRDARGGVFCYQEVKALAMIRGRDRGARGDLSLAYALAVYCAMTEIANEQRAETFRATRKEIAAYSGTSVKTVDRVAHELEEEGLLHVERRGAEGEASLWTLLSPDGGVPEGQGGDSEGEAPIPPSPGGGDSGTPPTSSSSRRTTSSSSPGGPPPKSKAAKERQFLSLVAECGEFDPKADPAPEAVTDGLELLRTGKKVGSKLVTPAEMATAAACISAFNRCFEWKDSKGSDYGLAANLTSIVERVRERPSWDIPKHVRLVESAWRIRWWERNGGRRPQPNVIFGGKSFENVVQDARDEAAGEAPSAIKKRRYTRG